MFRYLLFLTMTLLTLNACEEPIELDLESPKTRLAVVSNFLPGELVQVQVSKTQSVLTAEGPTYIDNAEVSLYQGNTFLERLEYVPGASEDNAPFYISKNFRPDAGITYTLKIDAPGYDPVQAQSEIPAAAPIRSLRINDVRTQPRPDGKVNYIYKVSIIFTDPAAIQNFYHLNFYQQIWDYSVEEGDTLITEDRFRRIDFSSGNDNNSLIAYFDGGVLFEDRLFAGQSVAYSFELATTIDPTQELIGNMIAELRTTSQDYYLYHNSLSRQQTSTSGPLIEPVIVYNNIQNGRGIFAGYNASIVSVAIIR